MASYEEKKASHLKIAVAVGSVLLIAVVVGTVSGSHPNRKATAVKRSVTEDEIIEELMELDKEEETEAIRTVSSAGESLKDTKSRSVKLEVDGEIIEETVEVDKERDTETFRTVSSAGTSFVFKDMKTGLSAYGFDGDEKCYILDESLEDSEDTEELSKDLEQMEEGEVDPAEREAEMFLSVDEERGQVDRSEVSEGMAEFCEGLQPHWAVKSSTGPSANPEEEEEEADSEAEVGDLPGTNGAVLQRGKRVVGTIACHWVTKNVCPRTCKKVCGKRRRRGLQDDAPEQEVKKRAKRGWIRRAVRRVATGVRRVASAVCKPVCSFKCGAVRAKACSYVG